MRALLVAGAVLAGCTTNNYFNDSPDLTGWEPPRDAAGADASASSPGDSAVPLDLSSAPDQAVAVDLAPPLDFSSPPDLTNIAYVSCIGKSCGPKGDLCGVVVNPPLWCDVNLGNTWCAQAAKPCRSFRDCCTDLFVGSHQACKSGLCCRQAMAPCEGDAECCSGSCPGWQKFNGHCQ